MSRRTPWGANVAKAVAGDPYQDLPKGTAVGDSCQQALVKAGLDWDVELRPLQVGGGKRVDRYQGVVRNTDGYALGVVGTSYQPIQNVEMAQFADELASQSGAKQSVVGSVDGGRRVYAVVDYGNWTPPGFDRTDETIHLSQVVFTTHNGAAAFTAGLYPLREQCTNGMLALIADATKFVRIRHSASAEMRLKEARRVLGMTEQAVDELTETVERLIDTAMTDSDFQALVQRLIPVDEEEQAPATVTRRTNQQEELFALWGDAGNLAHIAGTGYAAVNAVAEWEQWERPTRGDSPRHETHMMRLTGGNTRDMASRARALVLAN